MDSPLLTFESDVPTRRALQPPGARRHPGKLHLGFLAWLLDRYAPRGGRLLDPFGGSGGLLLATLPPWGCDVLLNELERPWWEQACAAWAHMQASPAQPRGHAAIWCGDSRHLGSSGLLPFAGLVTSPPYQDQFGIPPSFTKHGSIGEFIKAHHNGYRPGYDAVVTSPPYADAVGHQHESTLTRHHAYTDFARAQAISQGYDAAITSPPYQNAVAWQRHPAPDADVSAQANATRAGYDALLTSPPYEDALNPVRHATNGSLEREQAHDQRGGAESRQALRAGYGERNPAQIGNARGARYWALMAEVWAACVPLVRPGGVLVVVLKNIVRANQEVDLIGGTRAQLEALGCRYVTTHYRAVAPGPFHRIRQKARPDALVIDREGALIMERGPC